MRCLPRAVAGAGLLISLCVAGRAQQIPVFRASSRLVEFTVVVERGNSAAGSLTKGDFRVTDNGKPRTISVFEASAAARKRAAQPAPLPPGEFSNAPSYASERRRNLGVILLDCLNSTTRMAGDGLHPTFDAGGGCAEGKQGIARYFDRLGADDSVALWALDTRRLEVLSDFSTNKAQLLAGLRRFQPARNLEGLAPFPGSFASAGGSKFAALSSGFDLRVAYAQHLDDQAFTLAALRAIGNHLARVPGRVSLIWVTAAPCIPAREIAAALGNQRVAVYPVDARELITRGRILQGRDYGGPGPTNSPFKWWANCSQSTWQPPGQNDLNDIAARTGGVAFMNTNDLAAGIRQAVEDSAESYTLGFYVGSRSVDNKFHLLHVRLTLRGLRARYPSGYWATADTAARSGVDPMAVAIGSPVDAEGIPITARVAVFDGNRLIVSGAVGIGGLELSQRDGVRRGAVTIGLVGQNAAGVVVQRMSNPIRLRLTASQYAAALRNGLQFRQTFTPAAGVVTVRILAEEPATGNVGSLIIPLNRAH